VGYNARQREGGASARAAKKRVKRRRGQNFKKHRQRRNEFKRDWARLGGKIAEHMEHLIGVLSKDGPQGWKGIGLSLGSGVGKMDGGESGGTGNGFIDVN